MASLLLILALSVRPVVAPQPAQDPARGLRLMVVATEAEGQDLRARIQAGESFDRLAREHSIDPTAAEGGYLGTVVQNDLRTEFRRALDGVRPGQVSALFPLNGRYYLLAWLTDGEQTWIEATEAGLAAFAEGRYGEARRLLSTSLEVAEEFGPNDSRLAASLSSLANAYAGEGLLSRALPLYRRSLEIQERTLGPEDPALIRALNELAGALYQARTDLTEAGALFERVLALTEAGSGPDQVETAVAVRNVGLVRQAQGDHTKALSLLERSLDILERSSGDDALETALVLEDLAESHRLLGDLERAETLARRSLELYERLWGRENPALEPSLTKLARVYSDQKDFPRAAETLQRVLVSRWRGPGRSSDLIEVLDAFTQALSRGSFEDGEQETAFSAFLEKLSRGPFHEDLYVAMADLFLKQTLYPEACRVMRQAVEDYPNSRALRYQLGETYATSMLAQEALETFGSIRPASAGERSLILARTAEVLRYLLRYDEARRTFEDALEADPSNLEARRLLSDLEFEVNLHEEALDGYTAVLEQDPENVQALAKLAEVHQLLGHHEEAAAVAAKALELDPSHVTSHFVRGMALRNLGQLAPAQTEILEYNDLQAAQEAAEQRSYQINSASSEAGERVTQGEYEDAIAVLDEALEAHPDAERLYLNKALLQERMGADGAAIQTLELREALGIPADFQVQAALARDYRALDDEEAGEQHRAMYLQRLAQALEAGLR